MKSQIRKLLQALLSRRHIHLGHLSDVKSVLDTIALVHPIVTNHRLIRMGNDGDGGYLVPDDLVGISACFSPGVGYAHGFEQACADRGIRVHMADPTVPDPSLGGLVSFTPKWLAGCSSETAFTLDQWIQQSGEAEGDLMLQMDIEGMEYDVLLGLAPDTLERFRVIVIEFHALDAIWNSAFHQVLRRVFGRLSENHSCVHIHPNNLEAGHAVHGVSTPPYMEFTFLRNDRILFADWQREFPHPLDQPNNDGPDLVLPQAWRGHGELPLKGLQAAV